MSSEYGWSDEQILDMTMARLRQVREVIWERQAEDRLEELTVREIELKTLASFVAGAAGWSEGQKAAKRIRLVPVQPSVGAVVDADTGLRMIPAESVGRLFDAG